MSAPRVLHAVCALSLLHTSGCTSAAWGQTPPGASRDAGRDVRVPPRVGWLIPAAGNGLTLRGRDATARVTEALLRGPPRTRAQVRQENAASVAEMEVGYAFAVPPRAAVPAVTADPGGSISMGRPAAPVREVLPSTTEVSGPGVESLPVIRASLQRIAGRYRLCFQRQPALTAAEATLRFVIPADASVHDPSPVVDLTLPDAVDAATRVCLQRTTAWVILYTRIAREAAVVHTLRYTR
jgi:hypothetical protein